MTKTAVYLRVSTADQAKGLLSQRAAIKNYIRNHGITGVKWYVDQISGAKPKRPALDKLQRDIFTGEVKTVITWALDRLTRRGPRDGLELLSRWMKQQVRVISITEALELGSDTGEMVASLLFSIAKMYRTKLIENTERGLAAAKARGVKLGKRPTLFYSESVWKTAKRNGDCKTNRPKLIQPLLKKGMTVAEIARQFQVSRQAIYTAAKRSGVTIN